MKNKLLLFIILFSFIGYSQNPTRFQYGVKITGGQPTVTSVNYLTITDDLNEGLQSKIAPVNLPIPYTPINYSISNQSIGQHLTGIDTRLGQISSTTAGITQRVYFTADNTTVTAGTFYTSSVTGKGTAPAPSPAFALSLADNTKGYFNKDVISIAQPSSTIGYAGTYSGILTVSATPTPVATQQRFTIEIYRTNNGGTPISSGVSGAPTGDLGVTVLAILDSGIINLSAGSITNVPVSGILTQNVTINTGERLRYHVSAAKIGTGGGNVTFGVYYGSSYNSYYDVPVAITTDAVINKSGISGVTSTDALNFLNTDKINGSGTANTLPVFTGTKTIGNSLIAQSGYSVGVGGVIVNDNIGDPAHVFNITNDTGGAGGGVDRYLFQATAYANNTGLANIHIRKARGTAALPLAVLNQDILSSWGFRGYATTKFASSSAAIQAIAEENFTDTANGTSLLFQVTQLGAFDSRIDALRLKTTAEAQFYNTILAPVKDGMALKFQSATPTGNSFLRFYDSTGTQRAYIGNFGSSNNLIIDNDVNTITINSSKATFNSRVSGLAAVNTDEFTTYGQMLSAVRPYKIWTGVFQNNGSSAPTVIVNENTLGGTVVWTRTTTGTYRGTLSGAFNATSGKTNLLFGGGAGITSNGFFNQLAGTADYVEFTTVIAGALSDSVLNGFTWIEIRVYP